MNCFIVISPHGKRLARIEANLGHMVTKEDIQKIKVWVLSGILGGVTITALLTATIVLTGLSGQT